MGEEETMAIPKISVIIPVYNVEPYLKKALDSVVNQTLREIEIICVDDCSTDNSLEILEEYAQKDERIIIIRQAENQGQGVARNIAIQQASGEYIMFLDPDDWLESFACEDAYAQISKNDNDIVFFNNYTYNQESDFGKIDKNKLYPFWGHFDQKSFRLKDLKIPFITAAPIWFKIYKNSYIKENHIDFAPVRIGEDSQFTIKAYLYANTVSVLNKPLYIIRKRLDSSTRADKTSNLDIYLKTKIDDLKFVQSKEEFSWILPSVIPYCVSCVLHFGKRYYRASDKLSVKNMIYEKRRKILKEISELYDLKQYLSEYTYKLVKKTVKYNYIQFKLFNLFRY